jgi:MoxR-like ATPase
MTAKLHAVTSTTGAGASLSTLRASLASSYVERDETIEALTTAILAGEHTFLLGPPGTGKSAIVRSLAQSVGLRYWEILLTRFSSPEDLFGPVMLSALQRDSFERATDHFLPCAEVAFLDEIWKANGGILNSLLTLLNERVFHNGGTPVRSPLVSAIGASNELPEGPELGALYDRFLIRLHVDYIADRGNFLAMLAAPEPTVPTIANLRAEQSAVTVVALRPEIFEALADLRIATQKAGLAVSDRRWRKCLSLVKASAHLDGRAEAAPDDLAILEHSLWSDPSERSTCAKLVQSTVNPNAARAVECLDDAREARASLPAEVTKGDLSKVAEVNHTLQEIKARLDTLGTGKKISAVRAEVTRLHSETSALAAKAMGLSLGGK